MKKPPSKVAHNRPRPFFSVLARLPKRPKNRNPVHTAKSPLMQDWVFRLGMAPYPEIRALSTDVWLTLAKQELVVTIPYFHYSSPSKQDFA